jgi:hypothetical protein
VEEYLRDLAAQAGAAVRDIQPRWRGGRAEGFVLRYATPSKAGTVAVGPADWPDGGDGVTLLVTEGD